MARLIHVAFLFLLVAITGCSRATPPAVLSESAARNEQVLANLSNEVATLKSELAAREAKTKILPALAPNQPAVTNSSVNRAKFGDPEAQGCGNAANIFGSKGLTGDPEIDRLQKRIESLEKKLEAKRTANNLEAANVKLLADEMKGHTNLYSLKGEFKVMVIPVQFADKKFDAPEFFDSQAQEYLFGNDPDTLASYYKHASMGKFLVTGEVTPMITVDGNIAEYGEAVTGNSDKNARELVVQALLKLREIRKDDTWWEGFDNWNLSDFDQSGNRHKPDGFVDAVVLITAGKPQASCQASFDPDRTRPASADVPPGPRHDAAVECFNRLWPHRWSISLSKSDPRYSEIGPEIEGIVRPSMNGLKITEHLFALDYNMQSEYSDRSTFIHEFGHSITLPDVYDMTGPGNSSGQWEVMSGTAHLQAQEQSTFSKISLGWVEPKIIRPGQATSAYLGAYNFVSPTQREKNSDYSGPEKVLENFGDDAHSYDVVSMTPGYGEPVYRSIVALMEPTLEETKIVEMPPAMGSFAAYSGKFDGESRSLKLKFHVPAQGDAVLKFDELHSVETETNFDSKEPLVHYTTLFDVGSILINGKVVEELNFMSGDANLDTLVEANADCNAARVLELRTFSLSRDLTDAEKAELKEKLNPCRKPAWVKKAFDLSAQKGKDVELEIRYVTDSGYTEMGIVADNFEIGNQRIDFENANAQLAGDWRLLKDGSFETRFSQFYMFEYRTPGEEYRDDGGNSQSYNMDNHIVSGTQAMFQADGKELLDRFRLFTIDYQPGVLVWYFNSRFDRRSNSPTEQKGKGYLLVLNSKVKEMKFPGIMGSPELFNGNGEYNTEADSFKAFVKEQTRLYKCFGAVSYYTYVDGEAPDCTGVGASSLDVMQGLRFGNLSLVDRREGFNDSLPLKQYEQFGVGVPMRNFAEMRTGLSTFRAPSEANFHPFKVYKAMAGKLVLDEPMTAAASSYAPVSSFNDKDNELPQNPRFQGDTVVVEKKGFGFDVAAPSNRILALYNDKSNADVNESVYRRPRARVIFRWNNK